MRESARVRCARTCAVSPIIVYALRIRVPPMLVQPTDLVKIRFQSEGRLLPGQAPRYTGVLNAYASIVRQEGVLGLWTGLGPAIARNSLINASELVTYDVAKQVRGTNSRGGRESCDVEKKGGQGGARLLFAGPPALINFSLSFSQPLHHFSCRRRTQDMENGQLHCAFRTSCHCTFRRILRHRAHAVAADIRWPAR